MGGDGGGMLQGKNIVVTGAESGIGRAIALACVDAGAQVCAAGLMPDGLKETIAKAMPQKGGSIMDYRVDIRDAAGARRRRRERGCDRAAAICGDQPR
jgi:NAD(P)-dependent dehydrogenase (short-subunit alcohol dehydrogenase family)